MKLAAIVESFDHVCCRYRLRAFKSQIERAGHTIDYHTIPKSWWSRLQFGRLFDGVDAVVLQRKLLSVPEVALLRRRVPRFIYDVDDAVWMRSSYSGRGFTSRKRLGRFRYTVRSTDVVVAGNAFLAENAATSGAMRENIIPTCVDHQKYPVAKHEREGKADLVWIGSRSTLKGLEFIRPMLENLGDDLRGVRLKIICDKFLKLNRLPVIECPWTEATEATDIATADIGISWIPDDPWSRGKCGLKVLQYMSAGLPVVANPVGVQNEMIRHGETGFLARTPDEWIDAIQTLTHNAELRRWMGANARRLVEQKYSIETGGGLWVNMLDRLK